MAHKNLGQAAALSEIPGAPHQGPKAGTPQGAPGSTISPCIDHHAPPDRPCSSLAFVARRIAL